MEKKIFEILEKMKSKKIIFIQYKENGLPIDKYLRLTEGSELHKKILSMFGDKLPEYLEDIK